MSTWSVMTTHIVRGIVLLALCYACTVFGEQKSFKSGQIMPDNNNVHINAHGGGFLYKDGLYYWFGEHKTEGTAGNLANVGVHCYSSADLYNWKDEGVVLSVSNDDASEIAKGCILERPKVIYNAKTGKYVMWFHLEFKSADGKPNYSTARCALAVADKPTGPYSFVRSFRPQKGRMPTDGDIADCISIDKSFDDAQIEKVLNNNNYKMLKGRGFAFVRDMRGKGQMARDMTLFVDDNSKAYLICSSEENSTLHIHELTDDYQNFTGRFARVRCSDWNEAPAIFKKDGKYYLFASFCTGWAPNSARSYVSESIYGPWRSLGNPIDGSPEQMRTTFGGQSTFVIPVAGKEDAFIFVADMWRPKNAIDGRYIFLPIEFENGRPVIRWKDEWDLSFFDK